MLCPPAGSCIMSTGEDARWLQWVTKQFESIAGEDKEINLEEFRTALQVKESFFAERFFALFDTDGSGTISLEELLKALSLLVHGTEMDKLRFLFQVYDVDGSGSIDPDELRLVLRWCLQESAITLPEERLGDLTLALFEAADKDHSGSITFEELKEELEACPEVMENLTISAVSWLKPPPAVERSHQPRCLTRAYWHNHRGTLVFLGGYTSLNLLLFSLAALHHASRGGWVMVARGCGQCLNFNCTLLAVFYWTHLSYISVWTLLTLHGPHFWKWFVVPGCLFVLEKVQGLAWRRAGGLRIVEVNLLPSKVTHLVIERPQSFHYKPGDYIYLNIPAIATYEWHPFTISSAPEQQETFWLHIRSLGQWTNKLYEYFQEPKSPIPEPKPLSRSLRKKRQQCWVQEGLCSRISSEKGLVATGEDGSIQLKSYKTTCTAASREEDPPMEGVSTGLGETHRLCSVKCYIDGPYGTPTRKIFGSEHAVLIGAGIGITPFASILQSIMYRYRRRKQSCPSCHYSWCGDLQDEEMALRKVDFIWINRDQKHFEWFVSLLTKLEMEQAEQEAGGRFLEMHMYMTSALSKNDMKAIGLQMALDLLATKEQKDSITGLRTRTQPGHPDWGKVFGKVAEEKRGKVQVFFCGPPALAKVIRAQCERFGFPFFKEHF
ncbi:NADPH oxidase 5 isoform X4 [Pogoniulus pusillus]|uniref:NADPH oxidase 5 isoform X4 n=1 Tax=Pogoniulus pusillus TaxID=488313 RepID=UPI0030B94E78